jgi:hypothetical protein
MEYKNYSPAVMLGADLDINVDLGNIDDSNGNAILQFDAVASSVNWTRLANAAAGADPTMSAQGADTNIAIAVQGKGTGEVKLGQATTLGVRLAADQPILDSSGNELVKFVKASTAINEVTITNAASGAHPDIAATGGGTNIDLTLTPKGTGKVKINDSGTATASGGAATLNKQIGVVTTEDLTTAAGASYVLTLTNSKIVAASVLMASVGLGTATTGAPVVTSVVPAAGSATITVQNIDAAAAVNGNLVIRFVTL